MLGAVASGFTCIMGNSLNILPKLAESICSCMKNGEIKSAQASQTLLTKAITNIYNHGNNNLGPIILSLSDTARKTKSNTRLLIFQGKRFRLSRPR